MRYLILIIFISLNHLCRSQKFEYIYKNASDSSVNCYLKVIPKSGKIKGLMIRDYSSLPLTMHKSPYKLLEFASQNEIMTLYTVTSKFFPELFYSDTCMFMLDEMVAEVIKEYNVPKTNIFMGGISASGTRALRYAQFCERGKSKSGVKIKGVFMVDSPLDLARFYRSVFDHRKFFKAGMLSEADLMQKVFPQKLGGSPDEFPERYLEASVFSNQDSLGGNAAYLKTVDMIIFHEPDIDWWLEERGASYFDINSYDIVEFVRKLRAQGNNGIKLITTTQKGYDRDGIRKCHSWSIVDEVYLIKWVLERMN